MNALVLITVLVAGLALQEARAGTSHEECMKAAVREISLVAGPQVVAAAKRLLEARPAIAQKKLADLNSEAGAIGVERLDRTEVGPLIEECFDFTMRFNYQVNSIQCFTSETPHARRDTEVYDDYKDQLSGDLANQLATCIILFSELSIQLETGEQAWMAQEEKMK